jgi:hypothetical protein
MEIEIRKYLERLKEIREGKKPRRLTKQEFDLIYEAMRDKTSPTIRKEKGSIYQRETTRVQQ